jgi:hypothetical protein
LPSKHVNIIPEEGDEHELLFVTQISHDAGGLGGIHADLDDLHGDVLVVQELLQREGAGGAISVDLDDTVGRCHLQDQVSIVGDDHELVHG